MQPLERAELRIAPQYPCKFCRRIFQSSQGRKAHVTSKHPEEVAAARAQDGAPDPALSALHGLSTDIALAEGPSEGAPEEQAASPHDDTAFSVPEGYDAFSPQPSDDGRVGEHAQQVQGFEERFTTPVATPLSPERQPLPYQQRLAEQMANGQSRHAPFLDDDEWELARWLAKSGLSQGEIDKFLKQPTTKRLNLSFKSSRAYLKYVDSLPSGPQWRLESVTMEGDVLDDDGKPQTETLELWMRDVVEIIKDLMATPAFADCMDLEPVKVWLDQMQSSRCYTEASSGDWWWELQSRLPKGALVIPVIIATDKTQLSAFSGDKSAYPVYITIGNIHSSVRRQPSSHATVLLGYLPVSKFEIYATAEGRSAASHRLFHYCMSKILAPLAAAGRDGIDVLCCDGYVRKAFMVLMSYIADYPEQCLVACCKQNQCPICLVAPNQRGEASHPWPLRTQADVLEALRSGPQDPRFNKLGLKDVVEPFWAQLPHTDIFRCFTPDILHELHKGAFGDHLLEWCTSVIGADEVDRRMKCLPRHPTLRHFPRGLSVLSQWTGKEYREVEKVFTGVVSGHEKPALGMAARALVDFIYCARMPVHNDATLQFMDDALSRFHEHKTVFLQTGTRKHFDIIKFHKLQHYVPNIRAYGCAPGYNSESPERMHIDYCKEAYRASNRRDYLFQMTVWLRRQEAVDRMDAYLRWCRPRHADNASAGSSGEDTSTDGDVNNNDGGSIAPGEDDIVHRLPLNPSYRNQTIAEIDDRHTAPDFLPRLNEFLRALSPSQALAEATDVFDVYKRVTISEFVGGELVHDVIRATPAHPMARGKTSSPFFDTALVGSNEELTSLQHTHLCDLQVVRVRVIFEVPAHLRLDAPLAFVEYFTLFKSKPSKDVGFLWTKPARVRGGKRTGVIRLDSIVSSCHLTPKFPAETPEDWIGEDIFEVCPTFHLNEHISDRMFGIPQSKSKWYSS